MWNPHQKHAKFEAEERPKWYKKAEVLETFVCWNKNLHESYQERRCILDLHSSLARCWTTSTWCSFPVSTIQGCVWEKKCEHLVQASTIRLHHWSCGRNTTFIQTHYILSQGKLVALREYINENLEKGFIWQSKYLVGPLSSLSKRKMAIYEYVLIIVDWINSTSKINTFYPWFQGSWANLVMPRWTPRLMYMEHTIWCAFEKAMNWKQLSKPVMAILNMCDAIWPYQHTYCLLTSDDWCFSWILGWFRGLLH